MAESRLFFKKMLKEKEPTFEKPIKRVFKMVLDPLYETSAKELRIRMRSGDVEKFRNCAREMLQTRYLIRQIVRLETCRRLKINSAERNSLTDRNQRYKFYQI